VDFRARRLTNISSKITSFASDGVISQNLSKQMAKLMNSKNFFLNRKFKSDGDDKEAFFNARRTRRFTFLKNLYNCKIQNILASQNFVEKQRMRPNIVKLISRNGQDKLVTGKLKRSDIFIYAFSIATVHSYGGFGGITKDQRRHDKAYAPTKMFARNLSAMSRKFSTKFVFKLSWGTTEFIN
jgi:hypothetical protein